MTWDSPHPKQNYALDYLFKEAKIGRVLFQLLMFNSAGNCSERFLYRYFSGVFQKCKVQ